MQTNGGAAAKASSIKIDGTNTVLTLAGGTAGKINVANAQMSAESMASALQGKAFTTDAGTGYNVSATGAVKLVQQPVLVLIF